MPRRPVLGLFFAYVVFLQGSTLFETCRHAREMQAQRDLADRAEASRFVELRNFLQTQDNTHMARNAERDDTLLAALDTAERASLAAWLADVNRLDPERTA